MLQNVNNAVFWLKSESRNFKMWVSSGLNYIILPAAFRVRNISVLRFYFLIFIFELYKIIVAVYCGWLTRNVVHTVSGSTVERIRHHFTGQILRKPDTYSHSPEGIHFISVLSNTHSVMNKTHGPTYFQNGNNTLKTKNVVTLVTCNRTYIYVSLKGLAMGNRGVQPLSFSIWKHLNPALSCISNHVN